MKPLSALIIPETMRAAQCIDYGDNVDQILSVQDGIPTPRLGIDEPPAKFRDPMLIRVLSVALAPGDSRVMSGKTKELQGPPSFPYTPGGDVCGIVVAIPEENDNNNKKEGEKCRFKVGDRIAARFKNKPMGMLGEYALVNMDICDNVPEGLSAEGAAALVSSGTVAVIIADAIREGDRVLIFGAGGGVGSHLCQAVRLKGASYVAGVGKDPERLKMKPLSCDESVDYTKTHPFNVDAWKDNPFDVVVDLAGGAWPALLQHSSRKEQSIVKPASKGGRFLTITPGS